jgi:hypothetical protein
MSGLNAILREIDNRIAVKKIEYMKRETERMNKELENIMETQLKSVNKIYNVILLKDKPVGSSLNAIRHLR